MDERQQKLAELQVLTNQLDFRNLDRDLLERGHRLAIELFGPEPETVPDYALMFFRDAKPENPLTFEETESLTSGMDPQSPEFQRIKLRFHAALPTGVK